MTVKAGEAEQCPGSEELAAFQLPKRGDLSEPNSSFLVSSFRDRPISLCNEKGDKVVRFFCPRGDSTCLVEIKLADAKHVLYSIQLTDSTDFTQIDWDFVVVNDPCSPNFNTHID